MLCTSEVIDMRFSMVFGLEVAVKLIVYGRRR